MKTEIVVANMLDMIHTQTLPRILPAADHGQSVPKMAQDILSGIVRADVRHILPAVSFETFHEQLPQIDRAGPETLLDGTFLKKGGARVMDVIQRFEGSGKYTFWLKAATNTVTLIVVFAEPIWTLAMFDISCEGDLPTSIMVHACSWRSLSIILERLRGMEPQIPLAHRRWPGPEDYDTIQAFNKQHSLDCARASLRLMQAVTAQAPLLSAANWAIGRACKTTEATMREVVWAAARRGGKPRRSRPAVKVIDLDCFGRPITQMGPLPMEDTVRRLKGEARPPAAERTPQVECRRPPVEHWVEAHYRKMRNGDLRHVRRHKRGKREVLEVFRLAAQPLTEMQPPAPPRNRPSACCDARNLHQADRAHKHRHRSLPAPAAAPLLPQAELR